MAPLQRQNSGPGSPRASLARPATARSAWATLVLVLAAAALPASLALGGRRGVLQAKPAKAAPDTSAVPEPCVQTGLNLQSACGPELQAGSKALGVSDPLSGSGAAVSVKDSDLRAFLAKQSPPSAGCCSAITAFNNAKCSCSPPVLELVKGFTGGAESTYAVLAQWLSQKCSFKLIYGPTCSK